MLKISRFLGCCFILCILSTPVLAKKETFDRDYLYLETGFGINIFSYSFLSFRSFDSKLKRDVTSDYHLWGYGDINVNFMVGQYSSAYRSALEVELGTVSFYADFKNNKPVVSKDSAEAYSTLNYFLVNFRKDYNIFKTSNVVFWKAGIGAGMVNNLLMDRGAVNVPNLVVGLGVGVSHHINNNLDLSLSYNVKSNLPYRIAVSNGIRQMLLLIPNTLMLNLRFKI